MTLPPTHEEIVELLGAFALDAVDGDERLAVQDHLRECPRCRDEVQQHREVAAHLAFAGEAAPEGVWGRIVSSLEPAQPEPDLGRLYPLTSSRRRRGWATMPAMVAAAAVIVVLVGALGWQVHRQGDRVQSLSMALKATGLDRAVQGALLDPQTTKFSLASVDGRIRVDAVLEPDGTGFLVPGSQRPLASLPPSETYQLWGIVGSQHISLGLLGPRPGVVAFRVAGKKVAGLAVTVEHAGGVVQSSHAPVVAGFVPGATTA